MSKFKFDDKTTSVKIGTRLRVLRQARGMSQEALGSKLGITFQQVQKYEKGTNRISVPTLLRICQIFHCEPMDIISAAEVEIDTSIPALKVSEDLINLKARIRKAVAILRDNGDADA